MPDREQDLERELRELGSHIEYPEPPDLARSVRRRLDAEAARRRGWPRKLATPRWAAAAATLLISLSLLSPAVRSTVSDTLSSGASGGGGAAGGAGASSAEYAREAAPQPAEGDAPASAGRPEAPPGKTLGLGERLTMTEARDEVGRLLLPESPELTGEPRALYDAGSPRRAGVVLVFGPGPDLRPLGDTDAGLLLVEVPGSLASAYPGVATASRPSSEEVDVGGRRGYWFPDGRKLRPQPGEAERLPGGALLWEQGEATLLLRAGIPREEAVRIAETVR